MFSTKLKKTVENIYLYLKLIIENNDIEEVF